MLSQTQLHCFFQLEQKLLLLLVPLLYFIVLLFDHFNIVLGNVRGSRGRHDDAEENAKSFLFNLCIVNLGTITGLSDKLNRTLNAQS